MSRYMLIFSPLTWMKLQFMCHIGDTEIGGFGVSKLDDLKLVEEFHTVKQEASAASVDFDDDDVNRYMDDCVDRGIHPARCMRIWLHTHPGDSPNPSGADESTFSKAFGSSDYAIMFILAKGGATYCRLRYNLAMASDLSLDVGVSWKDWPDTLAALEKENKSLDDIVKSWHKEYTDNVSTKHYPMISHSLPYSHGNGGYWNNHNGLYRGSDHAGYDRGASSGSHSSSVLIDPKTGIIQPSTATTDQSTWRKLLHDGGVDDNDFTQYDDDLVYQQSLENYHHRYDDNTVIGNSRKHNKKKRRQDAERILAIRRQQQLSDHTGSGTTTIPVAGLQIPVETQTP